MKAHKLLIKIKKLEKLSWYKYKMT